MSISNKTEHSNFSTQIFNTVKACSVAASNQVHRFGIIIKDSFLNATPPIYKTDIVVLGGGTAGLTSAIYLGRAGLSPLVIDPNFGGAITQSHKVENFPGFEGISGLDLADLLKAQAEKNGASFSSEALVSADLSKSPFILTTTKRTIYTNSCIVALGATANKLNVLGEEKYWAKGVHNCAVCDGSFYKDKIVAVVGGGDAAILEADYLAGIAKKVYVLIRKDKFKGVEKARTEQLLNRSNVEVLYNVNVKEIKGNDSFVEGVHLVDSLEKETDLPLDGVFLAIGSSPNTKFFENQLKLDDQKYIETEKECETSVPGVFVAGDIADPKFKQAIIASGEGAKAAMKAQMYLASIQQSSPALKKEEPTKVQNKVINVSSLNELQEIIAQSKLPVLVDFYATWCPPCRYLSPFMDTWAEELQGKALICKVNVDEAKDASLEYSISAMPTLISIDADGHETARISGSAKIINYVEQFKKLR